MIYVVRHGQTDWNIERKLQGRKGIELNDTGIIQAFEIQEKLSHIEFDYAFSSPQERSIQTASIICGFTPTVDPKIDVFDLGEADGLPMREVSFKGPIPDPAVYQGVESLESFTNRVFSFLEELKTLEDKNILIVGHRCTTGCIGAYFNGRPSDEKELLKWSSNNGEYATYSFT